MERVLLRRILKQRLLLHVLFWGIFTAIYSIGMIGSTLPLWASTANVLGTMAIYFFMANSAMYFFYDYLIMRRKMYVTAGVITTLLVAFCGQLSVWLHHWTNPALDVPITFINFMPFFFFLVIFTCSLKISRRLYLSLLEEIEDKEALLQQKDHFLKSQISPHFLFNTLNNFYGLAMTRSTVLPDLMLRLSNILRHQIYNSEARFVPLDEEIAYLRDYVELEKIRYGDNLHLQIDLPGPTDEQLPVAPAILIVFLENAFKHSKDIANNPIYIQGSLTVQDGEFHFSLANSFHPGPDYRQGKSSGFGLQNIQKRLDLVYGNRHRLETRKENGMFYVDLYINLKHHGQLQSTHY